MNREGSVSNFCSYEVTEGIQLLKLGLAILSTTEYNVWQY